MKRTLRLLVTLALSGAPMLTVSPSLLVAAESITAPEVSLDEVKQLVASKGAVLLDANSSKTYSESHIPGAVSFADNKDSLTKVLPSDKSALIVAYCGGPRCTAWEAAAVEAKKLGYTNIKHFKGGIKVWMDAGEKVGKKKA